MSSRRRSPVTEIGAALITGHDGGPGATRRNRASGERRLHQAVLLGIVATCKRVGVDVQAYLTWVFIRRGTHRARYNLTAAELTPAAYKRSLESPG